MNKGRTNRNSSPDFVNDITLQTCIPLNVIIFTKYDFVINNVLHISVRLWPINVQPPN